MDIVVQKYGGSSLADLRKLGLVADKIARRKRDGGDLVVVTSAMGKATDELLQLAAVAARTATGPNMPARRELDMLVSVGERTSMALLAIALFARGIDAVSFTGSQSGIITNDRHFDARIVEVRPHRIVEELARGKVVVVAGYQGMSRRREITTLGRGGSDTTAVALAAALGAARCEIYSDVDGVYSADPRFVADARHFPELDHELMGEMAACGAKVLHEKAVEHARAHGLTIVARRTASDAGEQERETKVRMGADRGQRAVVTDRRLALLSCPLAAAPALLTVCADAQIPLRDCEFSREELRASIPLSVIPGGETGLSELRRRAPFAALRTDVGSVSVVGVGIGGDPAELFRLLSLLPNAPLALSSSPSRVTAILPHADLSSTEARLHASFV